MSAPDALSDADTVSVVNLLALIVNNGAINNGNRGPIYAALDQAT